MTASEARCPLCGSVYLMPYAFSDRFEEARLVHWVETHPCRPALSLDIA